MCTPRPISSWPDLQRRPRESGTSAAIFIDPTANQPLATTPLPVDVGVPLVLDDAVFLPVQDLNRTNVVVDRTTWTVTATPDYGRAVSGTNAFDDTSTYLIADGVDVLVIDAHTFQATDTIEPRAIIDKISMLAVGPGALRVATGDAGILQRFDIPFQLLLIRQIRQPDDVQTSAVMRGDRDHGSRPAPRAGPAGLPDVFETARAAVPIPLPAPSEQGCCHGGDIVTVHLSDGQRTT